MTETPPSSNPQDALRTGESYLDDDPVGLSPGQKDRPAQAIHLSGKNGRSLVSVFVWHDDTFQVVDERGGARASIIDTHEAAKPKTQQVTL